MGESIRIKRTLLARLSGLLVLALTVAVLGLASPAIAHDDVGSEDPEGDCRDTCMEAKRTCALEARTALKGCKEECRTEEDSHECRKVCRGSCEQARDACKAALEDCREDCEVPPSGCVADCAADLRACLHDVGEQGRSCGVGCFDHAHEAAAACRVDPRPLACLFEAVHELAGCLRDCASGLHEDGEACHERFGECREACEGGSPGGGLLDGTGPIG